MVRMLGAMLIFFILVPFGYGTPPEPGTPVPLVIGAEVGPGVSSSTNKNSEAALRPKGTLRRCVTQPGQKGPTIWNRKTRRQLFKPLINLEGTVRTVMSDELDPEVSHPDQQHATNLSNSIETERGNVSVTETTNLSSPNPVAPAPSNDTLTTVLPMNNDMGHSTNQGIERKTPLLNIKSKEPDRSNNNVSANKNLLTSSCPLQSPKLKQEDPTSVLWTSEVFASFIGPVLTAQLVQTFNPDVAKLQSRFSMSKLKRIGKGQFGVVYGGTDNTTQKKVAIKEISLNKDYLKSVMVEAVVSMSCRDANLVSFIEAYSQHGNWKVAWLVMEYMPGGNLAKYLGAANYTKEHLRLTEVQIAAVCLQVLRGLKCLHDSGVIHRDIKPDNILLNLEGVVKICDHGSAANSREENNEPVGSTFWYAENFSAWNTQVIWINRMAPEAIEGLDYKDKVDIWSVGIIVFEMALGTPPHYEYAPIRAAYVTVHEDPPSMQSTNFSTQLKNFVRRCLNKDADKRPTVEELLIDPFLSDSPPPNALVPLILSHKTENLEGQDSQTAAKETTIVTAENGLTSM